MRLAGHKVIGNGKGNGSILLSSLGSSLDPARHGWSSLFLDLYWTCESRDERDSNLLFGRVLHVARRNNGKTREARRSASAFEDHFRLSNSRVPHPPAGLRDGCGTLHPARFALDNRSEAATNAYESKISSIVRMRAHESVRDFHIAVITMRSAQWHVRSYNPWLGANFVEDAMSSWSFGPQFSVVLLLSFGEA